MQAELGRDDGGIIKRSCHEDDVEWGQNPMKRKRHAPDAFFSPLPSAVALAAPPFTLAFDATALRKIAIADRHACAGTHESDAIESAVVVIV